MCLCIRLVVREASALVGVLCVLFIYARGVCIMFMCLFYFARHPRPERVGTKVKSLSCIGSGLSLLQLVAGGDEADTLRFWRQLTKL